MNENRVSDLIKRKELKVSVVGLGRIGLPTAVKIAHEGFKVIGVDINERLIEDLKDSKTFVDEPGLADLLCECNEENCIEFSTDVVDATRRSDFIIVCLPTPINEDMGPDYSIITNVIGVIGEHLRKDQVVIIESSVSPTTIERIIIPLLMERSGLKVNEDFGVCSCPERADPGKIIENFNRVPRIVGGSSPVITALVKQFYQSITDAQILEVSTPGTANAIKLTENIFRDVNIALVNELAILYEKLGIDIKEVIAGCSTKYNFQPHYPGPGVGGPCLPANPYYIIKDAYRVNHIPFLIRVAREVNDRMPDHVVELTLHALSEKEKAIKNARVTILGLSYKANVRDIQISPSLKIIKGLVDLGAEISVFDPYYRGEIVEGHLVSTSIEEAIKETDIILIVTDHDEFKHVDWNAMVPLVKAPLAIVDSRNILQLDDLPRGVVYCGVGRPLMIT